MEFVNIGLFSVSDSSVIAGIVSDKNGAYIFNDVKEGNYFVQISFIGFETLNTPPFSIKDKNQQIIAQKCRNLRFLKSRKVKKNK